MTRRPVWYIECQVKWTDPTNNVTIAWLTERANRPYHFRGKHCPVIAMHVVYCSSSAVVASHYSKLSHPRSAGHPRKVEVIAAHEQNKIKKTSCYWLLVEVRSSYMSGKSQEMSRLEAASRGFHCLNGFRLCFEGRGLVFCLGLHS